MKPRTWLWLIISIAALCAAVLGFFLFSEQDTGRVLVVRDALDPMSDVIEPYCNAKTEFLNPYRLAHRLPGLNGIAFVFGTQARCFQQRRSAALHYTPLYTATLVIAVNRCGNAANEINGWRTMLASEGRVLMPHNATEGGRLAAIALARALGAKEGDFSPAINALARLNTQGRLNPQEEYWSGIYEYLYDPDRLPEYDAVVLWDYQARALSVDQWEIVIPIEGTFSVDCGFVYGGSRDTGGDAERVRAFLLSEEGARALQEAGFAPLTGQTMLSKWDEARFLYNPQFRRVVLLQKLNGPASVLERVLLQSATALLFCIATHRVLRRIPDGPKRTASFWSMLFTLLWLLTGIVKALVFSQNFARYCWFFTYVPRHILPVCWLCMSYANRYDRLPSRKNLTYMLVTAFLLTAFVFANDLHRQVFIYMQSNPQTWADHYSNGWGYYLSLLWSFSLLFVGLVLFVGKKRKRMQRRQMLYAGILFSVLVTYQALYVLGVEHILDLDIPSTIAACLLMFNAAMQRERFMGASLLSLPLFHNSPYAIAVYDDAGRAVYRNAQMESLKEAAPESTCGDTVETEFVCGKSTFLTKTYALNTVRVLVLEDITAIKHLEGSLEETRKRLNAVRLLLIQKEENTPALAGRLEQDRYSRQMECLLKEKLQQARQQVSLISAKRVPEGITAVPRARFLLYICQHRLRFLIRSMERPPVLLATLVRDYMMGLITDGRRVGLDGVMTGTGGACSAEIAAIMLELADSVCLFAFDTPGTSLVGRIEATERSVLLGATFFWEEGAHPVLNIPDENLKNAVLALGGGIKTDTDEDGCSLRLFFPCEGVAE